MKQQIQITMRIIGEEDRHERVDALHVGQWCAVHQLVDDNRYRVTHLPTGLLIAKTRTKREAQRICRAAEAVVAERPSLQVKAVGTDKGYRLAHSKDILALAQACFHRHWTPPRVG